MFNSKEEIKLSLENVLYLRESKSYKFIANTLSFKVDNISYLY